MGDKVKQYRACPALGLSCAAFAWLAFLPYHFGTGEYAVHPAIIGLCLFLAFFTGMAASIAFSMWLDAFRCNILKRVGLWAAAIYTVFVHVLQAGVPGSEYFWPAMIGMFGIPAAYVFYYLSYRFLVSAVRSLFTGSGKMARHERIFVIVFMLSAAGFAWTAFYRNPILYDGTSYGLSGDIVYMFDSQYNFAHDSFFISFGGANDFRNIFFGLFSWPLVISAHVLSDVVLLVSGLDIYPYLLVALQLAAISLSVVLFGRMASKIGWGRIGFYLLIMASYPVLLNILILEQYAFPLFWMAVFLYSWLVLDDGRLVQQSCLAGSGCLIANSAMLVPMFLYDRDRAKKYAGNVFIAAVGVLCASGQIAALLYNMFSARRTLLFFGANIGMEARLKQFSVFLRTVFLQPPVKFFMAPVNQFLNDHEYAAYGLSNDIAFNIFGIAVLCVVILGAVLNYKDRFSVSCAWWCVVSFLILVMAGWGSYENGYAIYALYFGWAFVTLAYKFLEKILGKRPKVLFGVCAAASAAMFCVNMRGILGLLSFLGQYYPA